MTVRASWASGGLATLSSGVPDCAAVKAKVVCMASGTEVTRSRHCASRKKLNGPPGVSTAARGAFVRRSWASRTSRVTGPLQSPTRTGVGTVARRSCEAAPAQGWLVQAGSAHEARPLQSWSMTPKHCSWAPGDTVASRSSQSAPPLPVDTKPSRSVSPPVRCSVTSRSRFGSKVKSTDSLTPLGRLALSQSAPMSARALTEAEAGSDVSRAMPTTQVGWFSSRATRRSASSAPAASRSSMA